MQHWLSVGSSQVRSAQFNWELAWMFLRLWLSFWMVLDEADSPLNLERSYTFTGNGEPTESQLLKLESKYTVSLNINILYLYHWAVPKGQMSKNLKMQKL